MSAVTPTGYTTLSTSSLTITLKSPRSSRRSSNEASNGLKSSSNLSVPSSSVKTRSLSPSSWKKADLLLPTRAPTPPRDPSPSPVSVRKRLKDLESRSTSSAPSSPYAGGRKFRSEDKEEQQRPLNGSSGANRAPVSLSTILSQRVTSLSDKDEGPLGPCSVLMTPPSVRRQQVLQSRRP
eukprot:TRINITY_DN11994_c0_g1_i1.p1 TRINITY_DN11994_c0_g1~~TRINITY_DN11994_c0_g1_i1.p1  ORF type:complete len:180 (-),score=57.00 TRINITY_DN11994_c0_g1_i1:4-543(-)